MKIKHVIIFLIYIFFIISPVNATPYNIDHFSGTTPPQNTALINRGSYAFVAGDVLNIQNNITATSAIGNIGSFQLTINGGGNTLDGASTNRGFTMTSLGNYSFDQTNLNIFKSTTTTAGGAITNAGTLSFTNGNFNNNSAINGAAIYNTGSETITGTIAGTGPTATSTTTFFNNTSTTGNGGTIYTTGTSTITGVKFNSNDSNGTGTTAGGGAIYTATGTTTLTNDIFTSNTAQRSGGAIYQASGTLNVTGSLFDSNIANIGTTAASMGGAVYSNGGILNITNTDFTNNSSKTTGGALYTKATTSVTGGTFSGNTASIGGAIYNNGATTISGATFSSNTASTTLTNSGGGAIYNNVTSMTITDSTFSSNTANLSTAAAAYGGAIFNQNGTMSITGTITGSGASATSTTSFTRNTATTFGGAIYNNATTAGRTLTATGTIFDNNSATSGGALYNSAGVTTLTNDIFKNNSATTSGGAIYAAAGTVTVNNGEFIKNTASTSGGAIYNTSTSFTSTGSTFTDNGKVGATVTTANGGAVYNANGIMTITGGSFTSNASSAAGGAIYNTTTTAGRNISTNGTTFTSNSSADGGAVYNAGTSTFTNSDFISNSASTSGGAIYNASGTTTLTDSSFSNNTATTSGGAVYIAGGTVNVNATGEDVAFSGNIQAGSNNDIYMADSSILNLTANGFKITLNGGIQGIGTINKLGTGDLILSNTSVNNLFTGTYNNSAGNVQIQSAFFTGINKFTTGTADIQTGGSLTLNSGDSWTNSVISNTGGTLNFDGFSHTTGGAYNQNAGTLSLNNNGTASSFTLTSGSNVTGGNINFSGAGNTLSVATGGILNSDVALNLTSGNNFTVSGGTATLNGTGTGTDTWAGTVNISSGTLNLNSITSNGIYNQTGGATTIDSSSNITLLDSSNLGGGSLVTNGTLNLSNTAAETVATAISGTGTVNKNAAGASTFTGNNSNFTGTYNQTAGLATIRNSFFAGINNFNGGSVDVDTGGSLLLNSGDSWTTTNILTSGGALTLDGFSHLTGGTYNQTSGTLHLNNGSYLKIDGSSTISGGVVDYTGSGSVLDITTNGTFSTGATLILTLNTENIFRVSGGTATLSNTDTWGGQGRVDLTSGSLTLNGLTSNGVYTQTGGTVNLGTGTTLTLGTGSTISAGTVAFTGTGTRTLDVAAGGLFASDAVISLTTSGPTFKVSGGTATLNGSGIGADTWTDGGTVSVTGGTLALNSITSNGIYNQTGGTTTLASGSNLTLLNTSELAGGNLVVNGTLNLSNTAAENVATQITGTGIVNKNAAGTSTFTADDSGFTGTFNLLSDGIVIQNNFFGGTNNFTGASTTAGIQTGGNLILNSGDSWTNTNISTTGGSFTLDAFSHLTGGTYNQTSGALHLNNTSSLTLSTSNAISGGTVDFGGTGNLLNISTGGTFGLNTALNLTTDNTFRVSGGTATLGNNVTWSGLGKVDLTSGSLTLDGVTTNGIYTQSGGSLTLSNASGTASMLTLGAGNSISAGNVGFTGTGNILDISTGGTFASGATLNLSTDNTFRVSGGTATLTNTDTWAGTVNVTGGTLALNSITSNGIYNQTGGITTLASGSNLTLLNTSELGGGTLVTNGTLNLSNTVAETVSTQITGTGIVNKNAAGTTTFTTNESGFTGTYNQTSGGIIIQNNFFAGVNNFTGASTTTEIQAGGSLTLNSGDSWTNTNISTTGGSFTLDGFSHLTGGTYNQTSGALHLNNASSLTLSTSNAISGGTVDFGGTGNLLNIATGGTFGTNTVLNLTTDNTFRVSGGTATLGSNTTWSGLGKVDVTSGNLTVDSITASGIYTQSGGTSNFINSNLNTSSDIVFSGGTMNLNVGTGSTTSINSKIVASAGSTININKTVGSNPTGGTVNVNNSITGGADLNLYSGTMALSNESYINGNNLGIYGGTINTQNSLIGTMALNNLTFAGNTNWLIDVDLANVIGDKITSTNAATGAGSLNISGINLWSDASANLTSVVVADSNTKNYLSTSVSEVNGALFKYGVAYSASGTNGVLNFTKTGISPNAITGDVAQTSTFLLQTAIDRQFFGNLDAFMSFPLATRESTICCALSNGQATGAACPISGNGMFSPIYSCDLNRGIWAKNFVSFENIPLNNGPNVSTIEYGTLIGGDAPITNLGHGFVGNTSAYIGYLGSNQNYNQVGVSQNGALIGLAENLVKGNLFLTGMASVGYTVGNANTPWGMDSFSSLFAGLAGKGGYNFEFKDGEYIIQPNLMLAYTFTNTPPYRTSSGLDMNTKPLNALQVAPGIRLIKNLREHKGQVYLVANYVQNIMDNTHFTANDIELPQLSIAPYIEYGIGYQGVWKDRLTGFFQTLFRGGGRNGVAFQFGLRWAF